MIWNIVFADDDFAIRRSTVQEILRQIHHIDVASQSLNEIWLFKKKKQNVKQLLQKMNKNKPHPDSNFSSFPWFAEISR